MGACELVQEQYISEIGKLGESLDMGKETKWMANIIKEYHDLNKRSKEYMYGKGKGKTGYTKEFG